MSDAPIESSLTESSPTESGPDELSSPGGEGRAAPGDVSARSVLLAVSFAVFVAADDLTVVSTMLRPIINDIGLVLPDGLDDAAWIVNVYLIAFVAVMPIAGRVSDVIGRRRTFVASYAVFLVGTVVIPLADSLAPLLAGRVLTALGGGAMVPVALAVVSDVYPEHRRARALGTLAAIETLGWVWGPLYGAILVRFLDWRWQFWLNIPLALFGLALVWRALAGHDVRERAARVDWPGAAALTVAIVSLNLALLGNAEIQSVSGFSELTGGGDGFDFRLLFPVAAAALAVFVWRQRTVEEPLLDPALFAGRDLRIALAVNMVVGAALVIAMVDVPIFVNAVEINIGRAAVVAGWILSALTAAMAITSYVGGRFAERVGHRWPTLVGMVAAAIAYVVMGLTWNGDSSYVGLAAQLALLGAGIGLVIAPTTAAVVDAAPADQRGAAASAVMVFRLIGLSVGLSLLTAWGLKRFNELRATIELPPITDPNFAAEATAAQEALTAKAIAETFLASAVVVAIGVVLALFMNGRTGRTPSAPSSGAPMPDSAGPTQRMLTALFAVMTLGLVVAFILIGVLWSRLGSTQDDLVATRTELTETVEDLERVEAGAAIFAAQVTGFSEALLGLEPMVGDGIDTAIAEIEDFKTSTISFTVPIDETVEIRTEFVLDRQVQVPINETLPISETIDTTIQIDTPLGEIPLDITVPVDVDVPIDLELDIPVNETVPIEVDIPVKLDVPISIAIEGTELEVLATSLQEALRSLEDVVANFGG